MKTLKIIIEKGEEMYAAYHIVTKLRFLKCQSQVIASLRSQ
jgi:hypothetical protein